MEGLWLVLGSLEASGLCALVVVVLALGVLARRAYALRTLTRSQASRELAFLRLNLPARPVVADKLDRAA